MCQHDLPPIESVAYVPHTASTIHPGHQTRVSDFSAPATLLLLTVFSLNKPGVQDTCLSSSFKSFASHKLGQAMCVVGGGELVVGYGTLVVVRVTVIVWMPLGQKVLVSFVSAFVRKPNALFPPLQCTITLTHTLTVRTF